MTTPAAIKRGSPASGAIFSDCGKYRYVLWRQWDLLDPEPVFMAFIGLNPSTADESVDDPTIRRCIGFAKREGYSGLYMLNLFAYRATLPRDMKLAADPVGPLNDQILADYIETAGKAVACWGNDGRHQERDLVVRGLRRASPHAKTKTVGEILWCFGINGDRTPKHPLYLAGDTELIPFDPKGLAV